MGKKLGKILIVDDDEDVLLSLKLLLKKEAVLVETEKNPNRIPEILEKRGFDIILLDMNFARDVTSSSEGFYWLNKILEIDPLAIVILITAYGDVETAVKAIKEGATDFILKPWQNEKLLSTLSIAADLRRTRLEVDTLRSKQKQLSEDMAMPFNNIIGKSEPMQKIFKTIQKVAKTDANVLVLGENGTGKELVARAIHRESSRADEVFITVDLGAVTESLFESELFGYTKGAFTDAKEDKAGRFEIASGGTLFLDEIGNLSFPLQGKLLNVLEKKEIYRVGSNTPKQIDVRLICATNKNIHEMTEESKFRQDLLYRINTVEIHIPPLRERVQDILLLLEHFLKQYSKKYNKLVKSLSPSAIRRLQEYEWPGNVRELQHAVERAIIMSESAVLNPSDFFFSSSKSRKNALQVDDYNLEKIERTAIKKVLDKYEGNISKAAKELGLTRTSLYRRLEKYDI